MAAQADSGGFFALEKSPEGSLHNEMGYGRMKNRTVFCINPVKNEASAPITKAQIRGDSDGEQ